MFSFTPQATVHAPSRALAPRGLFRAPAPRGLFRARLALPMAALLLLLLLLLTSSAVLTPPATAATATSRPLVRVAEPRDFVPAQDGLTDVTAVRVQLRAAARLRVTVRRRGGRLVRVLAAGQRFQRGAHVLHWDGRGRGGMPVAPGSYTVSVVANGKLQHRSLVQVRAPQVSVHGLTTPRGYIAARRSAATITARYRLSERGTVAAVVVTADGQVVKNLDRGVRDGGRRGVVWDGRTDQGARAADGSYSLLITASAGGMPSATLRLPVRVDRALPAVTVMKKRTRVRVGRRGVTLRLRVHASEPVRLSLQRKGGGRAWRGHMDRGWKTFSIPAAQVELSAARRATRQRLRLTLVDAAGNARGTNVDVTVPGRRPNHNRPGGGGGGGAAPPVTPPPPPPVPPAAGDQIIWPTRGIVTSEFGPRGDRMHAGIDIAAPIGTPIVAARDGIVSFAGTQGGYGLLVVLEHPGGLTTAYAHLSRITVVVGQTVAAAQQLGDMGSTGHSTGPHLHFETRTAGVARNPRLFLPSGGPAAA